MKKLALFYVILIGLSSCIDEDRCVIRNRDGLAQNGCGNFMIYDEISATDSSSHYFRTSVDRDALNFTHEFQTFEIASSIEVDARIEVFNSPRHNYCTDAIEIGLKVINTYSPIAGQVQVRVVSDRRDCDMTYVVDLVVLNAVFEDGNGQLINIDKKAYNNVLVNFTIP